MPSQARPPNRTGKTVVNPARSSRRLTLHLKKRVTFNEEAKKKKKTKIEPKRKSKGKGKEKGKRFIYITITPFYTKYLPNLHSMCTSLPNNRPGKRGSARLRRPSRPDQHVWGYPRRPHRRLEACSSITPPHDTPSIFDRQGNEWLHYLPFKISRE